MKDGFNMAVPKVRTPPVAQCARAPPMTVPRRRSYPTSSTPGDDVAAARACENRGPFERKYIAKGDYVVASAQLWRWLRVCALCSRK